jgi:hypothetical protein
LDIALEGFVGETFDLPLYFKGCGEAVCVWGGGKGKTPDVYADV